MLSLALVLATGSVAAEPKASAVRSLLEMRHENVVIQQWDTSCGAAAVATLLTYQLKAPTSERQAALGMLRRTDPLRVRYRGGFSLLDMKRYAQQRGFEASGYAELTLDHLIAMAPLIVPVRLEGYDHFVVFRGVEAGAAVLADPAFGNRTVPLTRFERAWSGRLGFMIQPARSGSWPNRMPPQPADALAVTDQAVRASLPSARPPALARLRVLDLSRVADIGARIGARAQAVPLAPAGTPQAAAATITRGTPVGSVSADVSLPRPAGPLPLERLRPRAHR